MEAPANPSHSKYPRCKICGHDLEAHVQQGVIRPAVPETIETKAMSKCHHAGCHCEGYLPVNELTTG
ncbi:MAG: hypothetical protein K2R98_31985 [Gemmataceae bacterium]|nr:hypothetical protein [Gemmataceae bacterium]